MSQEMLNEVKSMQETARGVANGTIDPNATAAKPAEEEKPSVEAAPAAEATTETPAPAGEVEEEEIRIGDQTFKTQAEAFRYANQLNHDKELAEAHSAGVTEALRAQVVAPPPAEDKSEEEFWTDPRKAIAKARAEAITEAEARIEAKLNREKQWDIFLDKYPDIMREDAQRILDQNLDTIGKVEIEKGMQLLAAKTRGYYAKIEEFRKPRTVLADGKGTQTARSGSAPTSVTPEQKQTRPLTFAEEMKSLRKHS